MRFQDLGKFTCVVVDMVNGFVKEGAMADPNISKITPNIIKVLKHSEENRRVFFADTHEEDCIEFQSFPPHCIKSSVESEIVEELKPYVTTKVLEKNSTNGFHALENMELFTETDAIVVTGCCSDICVLQFAITMKTWLNEMNLPIAVIVPMDCIDTYDGAGHDRDTFNHLAYTLMSSAGIQVVPTLFEESEA